MARTVRRVERIARAATIVLGCVYAFSVPVGTGYTFGPKGACGIGAGMIGVAWGHPADEGYFDEAGFHFVWLIGRDMPSIAWDVSYIDGDHHAVEVALWPALALLALVWASAMFIRKRSKSDPTRCQNCGYTAGAGAIPRCPECCSTVGPEAS